MQAFGTNGQFPIASHGKCYDWKGRILKFYLMWKFLFDFKFSGWRPWMGAVLAKRRAEPFFAREDRPYPVHSYVPSTRTWRVSFYSDNNCPFHGHSGSSSSFGAGYALFWYSCGTSQDPYSWIQPILWSAVYGPSSCVLSKRLVWISVSNYIVQHGLRDDDDPWDSVDCSSRRKLGSKSFGQHFLKLS